MSTSLKLALASIAFVFIEGMLAYLDRMFFPSQMVKTYSVGFPFIAEGAMWGDLFLISAALYSIGKYAGSWTVPQIATALIVGLAVSSAMVFLVYLRGRYPDSLGGGGKPLPPAGALHLIYFGLVLAAILLFFFCSRASTSDIVTVSVLLGVHLIIANQVPLKLIDQMYHFPWCPNLLDKETFNITILYWSEAVLIVGATAKIFIQRF